MPNFRGGRATAFLLAQLGAHASRQFAERLAPLRLTPAHAGILRILARNPALNQGTLAAQAGLYASRMVAFVDEMETLGLIERQSSADDRRSYSLRITAEGREMLKKVTEISQQHNEAICAGLSSEERETLSGLLATVVERQGLSPGIHPGFSTPSGPPPEAQKKTRRGPPAHP